MHLEWLLNPVAPYAAVAIGMVSCMALFVSLKRDLRVSEGRWMKKLAAMETEWSARMERSSTVTLPSLSKPARVQVLDAAETGTILDATAVWDALSIKVKITLKLP